MNDLRKFQEITIYCMKELVMWSASHIKVKVSIKPNILHLFYRERLNSIKYIE